MKNQNKDVSFDKILSEIQLPGDDVTKENSGCACSGYNCGCCLHLELPKINLNDTGMSTLISHIEKNPPNKPSQPVKFGFGCYYK